VKAWDYLAPYVEPALTLGSAMAADIPAGLAGMAGMMFEGDDAEAATRRIEDIRDRLTYLPRSQGGVENLSTVADTIETGMEKVGDAAEWATGERQPFKSVGDWINREYGPAAAAAAFTAPEAVSSAVGFRLGQLARARRAAQRASQGATAGIPADIPRLPHAQDVRGVHFGNVEGLAELDPAMYGTGLRGAEASRLADAPDVKPRVHFYLDDRTRGERGTGPYRYEADLKNVYDLSADPLGIRAKYREQFTTPQDARINPGRIDWPSVMNETERFLRGQGYGGYMTPQGNMPAAVMFGSVPVRPAPIAR
jgi:hypothetical protein